MCYCHEASIPDISLCLRFGWGGTRLPPFGLFCSSLCVTPWGRREGTSTHARFRWHRLVVTAEMIVSLAQFYVSYVSWQTSYVEKMIVSTRGDFICVTPDSILGRHGSGIWLVLQFPFVFSYERYSFLHVTIPGGRSLLVFLPTLFEPLSRSML